MPVLSTVVVVAQLGMGALVYVLFKQELFDQLSDIRAGLGRWLSRPIQEHSTVHKHSSSRHVCADTETLKTIISFCGLGLAISLLCARYGLDLSGGLI